MTQPVFTVCTFSSSYSLRTPAQPSPGNGPTLGTPGSSDFFLSHHCLNSASPSFSWWPSPNFFPGPKWIASCCSLSTIVCKTICCGVSRGGSGGTASFFFFLPIILLSSFQVLGHLFVLEPALKGTALGRSMADWSTASNLKWSDQWQAASTYSPLGRDNGSAIWQHSQYLTQQICLLG